MRARQSGQIMVLFAFALLALLAFVGLAVDGGRLFQAHLDAQILADAAADAAAQRVDTGPGSAVRRGEPPELVPGEGTGSAYAAADDYLSRHTLDAKTSWKITARAREVEVVVEQDVGLAFFGALGVGPQKVSVVGYAVPTAGVLEPESGP